MLVFTVVAYGQKVKYKDLMVLINAKQYDQAEPFLKRYLTEVNDNPSAYLFMGIIYQEKAAKNDVLRQTEITISNIDSAIYFYDKSSPLITEKEVKKNDENYLMYTRRDLRTGEFGVKLSDIHLDIETRTKSLKERKDRVKLAKRYFLDAEAQYNRANSLYVTFQRKFNTKKDLYLHSDDSLISAMDRLALTFDSSQIAFKNYKSTSQLLGKTGYNQIIEMSEIKDFKKDGSTQSDFYNDELKLWNYNEWAKKTIHTIRDEVYPLRKELISFDTEINKLRDKIKKDSLVVNGEELRNNPVFAGLKKWDADPMPASLFQMKIAELEYNSNLVDNAALTDKNNISKKIDVIKHQVILLKNLDSLANAVMIRDLDKDAINYKNFVVSAYGTVAVLKSLARSTRDLAKRELGVKRKELDDNMSLLKYVISESDSIPLFKDVPEESRYRPLVINETFTAGVLVSDTHLAGYFYTVTSARTTDLKVNFPVDTVSITFRDQPLINGLSLAVTDQTYFILFYSQSKVDGKVPVTLARISRVAGLEWSVIFLTELTPVELKFTAAKGELSIKTTSQDGNSKMVTIDKTGKVL